MVDEAQRHRTTFDPREQAIMQQGIGSLSGRPFRPQHEEDRSYSIGDFFKNLHENINKDERYYNPPGGKTTTVYNPQSWFSSPYTGMAIGAALRGKGLPGAEEKWNKIPYANRLAEAGVTYNELPSSTLRPNMSRYDNTLGFDVDLGDLFNLNLGDLNLSYDYDLDDDKTLLKLFYNLDF